MKQIKKILILRFGAIGDVVHSSALFRSVKAKYPDLSIHYASFKTPLENIKNDPDLEKAWTVEGKSYKQLYKLANELKKENFDLFINLQPGIRTRIFSLMLGVKTVTYKKTFKLHAVENFWRTGQQVFKDIELPKNLHLHVEKSVAEKMHNILHHNSTTNTPLIAFNMGVSSTRQGRRWSLEYWKELAQLLINDRDCRILLTGSQDDAALSEELLSVSHRVESFCGQLSLEENTALLSLCDLVISGDTGPLHIATAVNTKCIGLYGAAPVSRTGIYGDNGISLYSKRSCVPCNRRKCKVLQQNELYTPCLLDIKPCEVFLSVQALLGKQ